MSFGGAFQLIKMDLMNLHKSIAATIVYMRDFKAPHEISGRCLFAHVLVYILIDLRVETDAIENRCLDNFQRLWRRYKPVETTIEK